MPSSKSARCDPKKVRHKDFEKLELRVGTIKAVKNHNNKKDYILIIDMGWADRDLQVVADLSNGYGLEELIGKQVIAIVNICPELIDGVESQAMLLVTTKEGRNVLLSPEKKTHPGVKVYGIIDSTCTHLGQIGQ